MTSSRESPDRDDSVDKKEQSFFSHLVELRTRLLAGILSVLIVLLSLLYFSNDLYHSEQPALSVAEVKYEEESQ